MAETYSVKAILSAADKGFSSTMDKAKGKLSSIGETLKGGLGFGFLAGVGQKAFSIVSDGISGVVDELGSSSAAWKTFNGNMEMLGKSADEISSTKDELQKFATQTIYSASDMATTYSQLAAVGTKNCTQLVKGFGGLASAAENPTQAMKTLSQQATQMASKPKVEWQDFKLMLEQTPAGIAAVAKQMGMSTSKLVSSVQDGKIKTDAFFDAITKVGTNEAFTKLATEYKTVDQAMDGLQETMGVKLAPAFDAVSKIGINAVSGIIDKLDQIDADKVAQKITKMVEDVKPYWDAFKGFAIKAAGAFGSVAKVVGGMTYAFITNKAVVQTVSEILNSFGNVLAFVGNVIDKNSGTISTATFIVLGFFAAYKGFKAVNSAVVALQKFGDKLGFTEKITKLPEKLDEVSKGQEKVGSSSAKSAKNMLASAKSFMMMGAGILMISAGFALLAYSAIQLANAGPLAIGVMAGLVVALGALGAGMTVMLNSIKQSPARLNATATAMLAMGAAVVLISAGFLLLTTSAIQLANAGPLAIGVMAGLVLALAGLAAGAAALGPALTAGAVGFVAFGAAILLVGTGALLAGTALVIVSSVLPSIVEYGGSGALAIAQLAAGMIAFGVGAIVASAGALALAVGLTAVGVGAIASAVGVGALAVAVIALGLGINIGAAGIAVLGPALLLVSSSAMASSVSLLALSAAIVVFTASAVASLAGTVSLAAGFTVFGASLLVVSAGMITLNASLLLVRASMKSISTDATSTCNSLKSMKSSITFVNGALQNLGNLAKTAINALINRFKDAEGKAKTAGQNIGNNISNGVQTGTSKMVTVSATAVSSTINILNGGRTGAYNAGVYIGQGLGNGMNSQIGYVRNVASQLASAAEKAIRAKAQIHSPSKVSTKLGAFYGKGYGNGIKGMFGYVKKVASKLVNIPSIGQPDLAFAGGNFNLSDEYSYSEDREYTINVISELDGKVVSKATYKYDQENTKRDEKFLKKLRGEN